MGSALTLVFGCAGRSSFDDADAGGDDGTTVSASSSASSTSPASGSADGSVPSGTSGSTGSSDDSVPSSTSGSTESSDTGAIDPACDTAMRSKGHGYTIDFGGWGGGKRTHTWDGSCLVGSVDAGQQLTTAFDCDGAEYEPTTISLALLWPRAAVPWVQGDTVTVHVLYNDYDGVEKVSMRRPSDSALLAAFVNGGAFVVQSDDIAPVTVTHDLEYCGWDGSIGDDVPIQLTFTAPDGNSHPLLRGGEATLTGLAGESWDVHLLDAYGGACCHNDTSVRVALVRNPS